MAHNTATDGTTFKQDAHRLGQNVETLKVDVSNLAHGAVDAARSGASELQQGARHAVENARDMARSKIADAKKAAGDATASMQDVIADRPFTSIALAAGAGLVIGMFLARRRD